MYIFKLNMLMLSSLHVILISLLLLFGYSILAGCPSEQDATLNVIWPDAMVNETVTLQMCPGDNKVKGKVKGVFTRTCISENTWGPHNVTQCRKRALMMDQNQARNLSCNNSSLEMLISMAVEIRSMIDTTNPILSDNIPIITDMLENFLELRKCGRTFFKKSDERSQAMRLVENCAMILDTMLNEKHDAAFEAIIENPQQRSISERLLWIIERVGILVALTFDVDTNKTENATFEGSHIVIDAVLPSSDDIMKNRSYMFKRNMRNKTNAPLPGIRIPMGAVKNQFMKKGRRIPIVNIFVVNLESRLRNDEGQKIASAIISSKISDTDDNDTKVDLGDEKIELMIDIGMLDNTSKNNPRCAFWNFTRDGNTGGFSDDGITQGDINGSTFNCSSNHLTSFAVLVDATGTHNKHVSTPALSIVSYVGCGISIVCLSLSILLMLIFRKKIFNQVRHFIHVNLSVALLLGLIVFVSGIEAASDSRAGCLFVAILLHYFFLAAFSWMLCEAIVLLIAVEFVFYEGFFSTRKFFAPLGWGLPIPIVAISAAVSHEQYGTNGSCWISEEKGAIWGFLAPMLFIILINSIVYIIIVYQVFKSKHDAKSVDKADTVDSVKTSLKAAIILLPLLGMTWVFGLLAVNKHTTAFAWIFTILNSLQGLFIFLLYVVKNKRFLSMIKQHAKTNTDSNTNKTRTVSSSSDLK